MTSMQATVTCRLLARDGSVRQHHDPAVCGGARKDFRHGCTDGGDMHLEVGLRMWDGQHNYDGR